MSNRYLAILEVSQKQAYIFASNKLSDNVRNSNVIAWVTSCEYIERVVADQTQFDADRNLVYEGGGHTILQFTSEEGAKAVIGMVTKSILKEFPTLEVFAKVTAYDEEKTPGQNVKDLTAELEKKKAIRQASFHQGTFGIEKIDANTLDVTPINDIKVKLPEHFHKEHLPEGYDVAYEFGNLGGTENSSNFIAVVHIDGNGMGKRVEEYSAQHTEWDDYCASMRKFSEGIAKDFTDTFKEMNEKIAESLKAARVFDALSLKTSRDRKLYFPVRRIISEGDDITFVAEGRIGIEAASAFIKILNGKTNAGDEKGYNACAGVALVHRNYPFYRAYELAEALCSSAKKTGASLTTEDNGASVSLIDWHIEYGEIKDSLEDTRKEYITADKKNLEMRPYIIRADQEILDKEPYRQLTNFRSMMRKLEDDEFYGSGVLKELRSVLKQGENATNYYIKFHNLTDIGRNSFYDIYQKVNFDNVQIGSGKKSESRLFVTTADGKERSILFDGIELMDTYVRLED